MIYIIVRMMPKISLKLWADEEIDRNVFVYPHLIWRLGSGLRPVSNASSYFGITANIVAMPYTIIERGGLKRDLRMFRGSISTRERVNSCERILFIDGL
jgi:hypothetical protein